MSKIYKYDTRYIVEFKNKTRASYSKIRYGDLLDLVTKQAIEYDRKIWNPIIEKDNHIEILYWDQSQNKTHYILIDKDFKEIVFNYYWQLNHNGYPQTRTNGNKIYLHRLIMNSNELIDHIDINPLNNKKTNLRFASASLNMFNQNMQKNNTSGVVGVSKKGNRWRARIQFNGKSKEKSFDTFEEACEQRKNWENEINKTL